MDLIISLACARVAGFESVNGRYGRNASERPWWERACEKEEEKNLEAIDTTSFTERYDLKSKQEFEHKSCLYQAKHPTSDGGS